MYKRIILGTLAILLIAFTIEAVLLVQLKSHLKSYGEYWKHTPTTGSFVYVALGDSTAQGIGASKPDLGYVGLLRDKLAAKTGQSVHTVNLSVSGAKINDVVTKQIPELEHYRPSLVTLDIGGNDVAGHYNSATFATSFDRLGAALPEGSVVANIPYFGGRIRHNSQALDANKHIAATAKRYHLKLVDLQTITRERNSPRVYAPDLFHPSNTGYRNWTDGFWGVIKQMPAVSKSTNS